MVWRWRREEGSQEERGSGQAAGREVEGSGRLQVTREAATLHASTSQSEHRVDMDSARVSLWTGIGLD